MGDLTLLSTTLTGGNAPDAYPRDGSAINNQGGTIRINNSTITGNSAPNAGGGIAQGYYRNTMIINNEGHFQDVRRWLRRGNILRQRGRYNTPDRQTDDYQLDDLAEQRR
ncbi:MAG TPA: hypothetical protein VKB53_05580 [Gammaproteobacteria bacterium]|jgi:hypothetical protein|nr:hypothetical protein [Gammaproteobacteria bacterium]HKH20350.1 hypothetical protein [Gammaproteobacteria bacterium]